jgi:class 3 adenylate cyclase/tetratricopeptide (TPR) repeat protein
MIGLVTEASSLLKGARFAEPEAYTPRHLAERILTSRAALEGERKHVTVLFADLKGSMELLVDRDPEEARELLDHVLERMIEAVHRYEGTVNQVMGDGIMALFGAPLAHEDHAVRACYAALRMQETVTQYGDEVQRSQGVPLQIRIGLNSGEVVVRSVGSDLRMDYTAVGQTTHLAARMEQMAKPGSILLTSDSLKLAEGQIQVRPLGPVPIRGFPGPIDVFELTGAGAARTRLQARAAGGLTPFVGRDAQTDQLQQALDRARAGHGQVVAVVGEAGVGKSRLGWEFVHSHRIHGWLVLEATSFSYGQATAYLPLLDLLKTYFQIEARDDARRIREKLTGKLLTLDDALRASLPAFLALLDVPGEDATWHALDGAERRRRTVDGIKRLFLRESQVQPLLVVVEDLHWVDPETQTLLDALVESLPTARLLLLVNYRPDYQHGWGSRTYYNQLRLDPLAPETADTLLMTLVGPDRALQPLRSLLIDRTQGNPFFLEECVRTLVETEILAGDRGAYRLTALPLIVHLPTTVHAVLAARIDRLPPEEKRLLQLAAVIGKDVPLGLLEAIADLADERLHQSLARLQATEFLYEARLFPEIEYTFSHALTAEVAYASLLQERRRTIHARIIEAMERLYPDRLAEQASRLAHHAFRGEVWPKALAYLRQTGAEASRASLDAVLGGPESPGHFWWTGDYERAITAAQRDLAVAAGFRDFALQVTAICRMGQAHHALGDYAQAADFFRRAITSLQGDLVSERFGMAGLPSVFSRAWLGWCLAERGEFGEGLVRVEEGREIADAADHAYTLILAQFGLGMLYLVQGDLDRARPALERGLVVARLENIPVLFPFVAGPLGLVYARAGLAREALPLLDLAVEQAVSMDLLATRALWVAGLAEAQLMEDRIDSAVGLAAQALTLAETHKERGHLAHVHRLLGDIAVRRQPVDVQSADNSYRRALALAHELGMRPLVAHCHLGLGKLYRHTGDGVPGQEHLTIAATMYREMGMVVREA